MMHNSLFLNRLIIYTVDNQIAYDETFHKGVNIIRGENSSGKSTITHFIFYVLGGAFNDWVKEAQKCSRVIAEVEMNGATLVLKSELNFDENGVANAKEPMYIHWGRIENDTLNEWQKFDFSTTENKISFSNVLFDALNIPIVKGDNNITMHQILRLIYIDQESPTSSLFFYEMFDTIVTRETVADLLLGVYNQDLYEKKQRNDFVEKEIYRLSQEIRAIEKYVDKKYLLIPAHVKLKIEEEESEIENIEKLIKELKEGIKTIRYTQRTKLEFEDLNEEAIKQRQIVTKLDAEIKNIEFDIADSLNFIEELENKMKAIRNSIVTRDFLGTIHLEYCPECLSKLADCPDPTICRLCKNPVDASIGVTQAKKIEQELKFQLKESKNLLIIKNKTLNEKKAVFESEKVKLFRIQQKVNYRLKNVEPLLNEKIEKLQVDKGFHEGMILQLKTILENAEIYQGLVERMKEYEIEKKNLILEISHLLKSQEYVKYMIYKNIEQKALHLLKHDLRRQKEFSTAKEFNIDFRNNIAFIKDKNERYSSSSNFYLKTSARYAIFLASLEIEEMRYPRFIFCDNMEDKGIEPKRAQNFQKVLVEMVERYPIPYQLIYTTSHILEEYNNTKYCVGDYYTEENKSLKYVN